MRMNLKNKCQTTYYMFRGGGTDFSLGGRVSKDMSWRDGPKLGGSGGMPPRKCL